jgi:ABC-2 type transport system permease protein
LRWREGAWRSLVAKEWRELMASRAWWVLLASIGPLLGVSFISAVTAYAEASGLGGTTAGVGEAFAPLDGVWVPTFAAYELAATFLLPFVAIRLVSGDRQSGALKLEIQRAMPPLARVGAKAVVLFAAWSATAVPALLAVLLWKMYGGSAYGPELGGVALGHLLDAGLVVAVGVAAASIADNPSTAAILTLAFTVGTWILGFLAAMHGGLAADLAAYTPGATLDMFEHGLIRLNALLAAAIFLAAGFGVAAVWLRLDLPARRRALRSVALIAAAAAVAVICARIRPSWDVSENRRHSFPRADEQALQRIRGPLFIEAHLAPQDPRRFDLEHRALAKLRRAMPVLTVRYVSSTSTGLFEQAKSGYGEIWYDLAGRKTMSRSTTAEAVLETIYGLAGVKPPEENEAPYPGHPLIARPAGAAVLFYGVWPALVIGLALRSVRRRS